MIGFSFIITLVLSTVSILRFDLQSKIESINDRFDDNSLLRLYILGVSDDVIGSIIHALRRTGDLSYVEIYDIFWMCSRINAGINGKNLLGERYKLIKKRIRSRHLIRRS
ncbi:hypothetical protein Xekj_00583 [Xenorhabdus sp. KJ12.1]|nr:hypothetical protein Xekj_00583 [Xenorhabdus sp. KJ12.1]